MQGIFGDYFIFKKRDSQHNDDKRSEILPHMKPDAIFE